VKRERSTIDCGSSAALAGSSSADTEAVGPDVRLCASTALLTTDGDKGASLDEGSSSLANTVPHHWVLIKQTIRAPIVDKR
jgi:hypothetical protein